MSYRVAFWVISFSVIRQFSKFVCKCFHTRAHCTFTPFNISNRLLDKFFCATISIPDAKSLFVSFFFSIGVTRTEISTIYGKKIWSGCYNENKGLPKRIWHGQILNLPENPETKLYNRYGENWRTPQNNKGPNNKDIY